MGHPLDEWIATLQPVGLHGIRAWACHAWFDEIEHVDSITPEQWEVVRCVYGLSTEDMKQFVEEYLHLELWDAEEDCPATESTTKFDLKMGDEILPPRKTEVLLQPLESAARHSGRKVHVKPLFYVTALWNSGPGMSSMARLSASSLTSEFAVLTFIDDLFPVGGVGPFSFKPLGLLDRNELTRSAAVLIDHFQHDIGWVFFDGDTCGEEDIPEVRAHGITGPEVYRLLLACGGHAADAEVIRSKGKDLVRYRPPGSRVGYSEIRDFLEPEAGP